MIYCMRFQGCLLFAFGDSSNQSTQLAWTVLPQGFRDSSHFFSQALPQDLYQYDHPQTKVHRGHCIYGLTWNSPRLHSCQAG